MDKSLQPLLVLSRYLRRRVCVHSFRRVSGPATKVDANIDLVKSYNEDIKSGGVVPVFKRALLFSNRVAIQDEFGIYMYRQVYDAAISLSKSIAAQLSGDTERTVCYMCPNSAAHVIVQWAIWMSGNIAVPLTPIHPAEMLKYFLGDSDCSLVVCSQEFEKLMLPLAKELGKPLILYREGANTNAQERDDESLSNTFYANTEAMLIYTSGTTNKPKGVVWTHSMLTSQIAALHAAWQYSAQDTVLHTLPLHHIHGQLNSLNASLSAGARIRMLPSFASHAVWARLLGNEKDEPRANVLHGVPAMYARLASDHERMFRDARTRRHVRDTLARARLMCAGSAPLPQTLFNNWLEISGQRLLERYGMSEVGMALSNPYRPVEARSVGCVGLPLPGISARIAKPIADGRLEPLVTVDCENPDPEISLKKLGIVPGRRLVDSPDWREPTITQHAPAAEVYAGELLLKGPAIFTRYWNRLPMLSAKEFTDDGWFRTGDTASFSNGKFRILGRTSVDIIKTSGYKVSALQVESALLEHPSVADAAVLGIEDEAQGEIVATVLVLKENTTLTLKELKEDAAKRLAPYQLPKTMMIVKVMPRNVMGKLDKKEIKKKFGKDLVLKR